MASRSASGPVKANFLSGKRSGTGWGEEALMTVPWWRAGRKPALKLARWL